MYGMYLIPLGTHDYFVTLKMRIVGLFTLKISKNRACKIPGFLHTLVGSRSVDGEGKKAGGPGPLARSLAPPAAANIDNQPASGVVRST